MALPHAQAPSRSTVPKPDLIVFRTRNQQRLCLLPLCAACMVQGIQSEHSLSVACQAGGAAHVCEAEDADDLAVGGDSDVGWGLGGAQEPDVCHLIIVANQLLGQLQPVFLQKTTAAWFGQPGVVKKQPVELVCEARFCTRRVELVCEARLYSAVAAQVSGAAAKLTVLGALAHILGLHASLAVQMSKASVVCPRNPAVQEHSK